MTEIFTGSFTQQLPLPDAAIEAAVGILQSGRLHRYNTSPGEVSEAAHLEAEFAAYMGAKYCIAVASGGAAMTISLRASGIGPGDKVLSNAFTLAPVPGAIAAVGATAVFVDVTADLTIDLEDLARKADATGAKTLLLSHMRGHICDMDRLMEICEARAITVIEDCAHTMGARWKGTLSGRHGIAGCYSTQTYKHMNSGEGGFIVTDDEDLAARAIYLSGSYMFPDRHGAVPDPEVFERLKYDVPNMSSRMDNLRAAILRPQLERLDEDCAAWTARYRAVEDGLRNTPGLKVIERPDEEEFVGSSIQFLLTGWPAADIQSVVDGCKARGVELKWFGAEIPQGFTSTYAHWRYADPDQLPATDAILSGLLDMRLPLTFSLDDCALIARIIVDEVRRGSAARPAAE